MPHSVRHVAIAKATRPKKRNNTKKHRSENKRRLERELGRPHQVRVRKEQD